MHFFKITLLDNCVPQEIKMSNDHRYILLVIIKPIICTDNNIIRNNGTLRQFFRCFIDMAWHIVQRRHHLYELGNMSVILLFLKWETKLRRQRMNEFIKHFRFNSFNVKEVKCGVDFHNLQLFRIDSIITPNSFLFYVPE